MKRHDPDASEAAGSAHAETTEGDRRKPALNRLLAWNVLEGLLLPLASGRRDFDEARRVAATSLIDDFAPDILVVNEALYCEAFAGRLTDFGALFGFPYQVAALYDAEWGNAILSRYPIVESARALIHPGGASQNRGALAARVRLPHGDVWVATLHPHPRRRPIKRAGDFLDFLARLRGCPLLLVGDMNAISPADRVDREALVEAFHGFSQPGDAENAVQRFLDAGRLLWKGVFPHHGLRDVVPPGNRLPTMPTALLGGGQESAIRIDHALATKGLEVVLAGAVRDVRADAASDHYPIMLDFRLGRRGDAVQPNGHA